MADVGVHIIVRGLVQGVGFRYFVSRQAARLGLAGRVRNLPGGDVEIEAEGPRALLEEFLREVRAGSRPSRVTDAVAVWRPADRLFANFSIE